MHTSNGSGALQRPRVAGKFLAVGGDKLWVRGVTYGAFRPDAQGREYADLAQIERDFADVASHHLNAIRIPHTLPPVSLLDAASRHGLRVMVGLSAEQWAGHLLDGRGLRGIERAIGRTLPRITLPDFDYKARPQHKLEIPMAQRIAAIRARKAEERARAHANAERRAAGPKPVGSARPGVPSRPSGRKPHGTRPPSHRRRRSRHRS